MKADIQNRNETAIEDKKTEGPRVFNKKGEHHGY
jgi:hypothetical protein